MKTIRYTAAAATIFMSLLNLPAAAGESDMPTAVAWLGSALGALGLVAAFGIIRRATWAPVAVVAIGALNLTGGVAATVNDWQGGPIGIALGLVIITTGGSCLARTRRQLARNA